MNNDHNYRGGLAVASLQTLAGSLRLLMLTLGFAVICGLPESLSVLAPLWRGVIGG